MIEDMVAPVGTSTSTTPTVYSASKTTAAQPMKPVDDRKADQLAQRLKSKSGLKGDTLGQEVSQSIGSVGGKPDDVPGMTAAVYDKLKSMGTIKEEEGDEPQKASRLTQMVKNILASIEPPKEKVEERVVFDGKDAAMDKAFSRLMDTLGIHESAQNRISRSLEQDGSFVSRFPLDPRNRLHKLTPEQWQQINAEAAPFFEAGLDNGHLRIVDRT